MSVYIQNINKSYNTPIVFDTKLLAKQKRLNKALIHIGAFADDYLSLGKNRIKVTATSIESFPIEGHAWKTALKVISYVFMALILPTLAIIKYAYRNWAINNLPKNPNARGPLQGIPIQMGSPNTVGFIRTHAPVKAKTETSVETPEIKQKRTLAKQTAASAQSSIILLFKEAKNANLNPEYLSETSDTPIPQAPKPVEALHALAEEEQKILNSLVTLHQMMQEKEKISDSFSTKKELYQDHAYRNKLSEILLFLLNFQRDCPNNDLKSMIIGEKMYAILNPPVREATTLGPEKPVHYQLCKASLPPIVPLELAPIEFFISLAINKILRPLPTRDSSEIINKLLEKEENKKYSDELKDILLRLGISPSGKPEHVFIRKGSQSFRMLLQLAYPTNSGHWKSAGISPQELAHPMPNPEAYYSLIFQEEESKNEEAPPASYVESGTTQLEPVVTLSPEEQARLENLRNQFAASEIAEAVEEADTQ